MNKTKLIHDVDHKAWIKLAGEATANGVKIGNLLSDILNERYNDGKD